MAIKFRAAQVSPYKKLAMIMALDTRNLKTLLTGSFLQKMFSLARVAEKSNIIVATFQSMLALCLISHPK